MKQVPEACTNLEPSLKVGACLLMAAHSWQFHYGIVPSMLPTIPASRAFSSNTTEHGGTQSPYPANETHAKGAERHFCPITRFRGN